MVNSYDVNISKEMKILHFCHNCTFSQMGLLLYKHDLNIPLYSLSIILARAIVLNQVLASLMIVFVIFFVMYQLTIDVWLNCWV